jgi:hypothetical protein
MQLKKLCQFFPGTSCDETSTTAPATVPSTACLTYTVAGNANGAFCQFPFRYKGTMYYECTRIDNKRPWCSTTADYDVEKRWGVCSGKNTILQMYVISEKPFL